MNYDNLINDTLAQNKLIQVNEKIYLTKNQIEILTRYQIPFEQCSSIKEIIFLIEEILESGDFDEDLEVVSSSLQEFDYYVNYKK